MASERSVALNIIAEIGDYQKEISKIPGMTDKKAAAAALALQKRLTKGQQNAAKAASKAADRSAQAWATAGATIASALSVAAIRGAATALAGFVDGVVGTVDEINTLATATGLSNKTIAGLSLAAKSTGKELSDLVPADLAKKMLQAANGSIKAERSFGQLGVKATDSSGKLRSADVVLREVIDNLAGMENGTAKAALATDLLGSTGGELMSAFGDSSGLDAFVDSAERFGIDVGPEAAAAAGEWQRANAELGLALDFAKQKAIDALGGFDGMATGLENFTTGLVFAGEFVRVFSGEILGAMKDQLSGIAAFMSGDFAGAAKILKHQLSGTALSEGFTNAATAASETTIALLELRKSTKATSDAAADGALDFAGFSKSEKEAAKAADALAKAQAKATLSLVKIQEQLRGSAREATGDQLDGEGKILEAQRKRLASLALLRSKLVELGATGQDTAAATAAANVAAGEINARTVRDLDALQASAVVAQAEREDAAIEESNRKRDEALAREEERQAKIVAGWLQALDVVQSLGNTALGVLAALQSRQSDAAAEALADARAAVGEMREQRADLTEQILGEEDAVKKAALEADLARLDSKISTAKQERKARVKASREAWKAEKGLTLSSIAFNGAAAVLKAFAMFGPPPSPAGVGAAAAAGLAAVAQAGLVATEKPPQFHTGLSASALGGLTPGFTRTPDERLASLTADESVLNGRASDAVGDETIRQLNATGSAGGGGGASALNFEGRHVDTLITKTLARGGAALRAITTVNRSRPAGQIPIF